MRPHRYPIDAIHRAFAHHAAAGGAHTFRYHPRVGGVTYTPSTDPDWDHRFRVMINGEPNSLTPAEAWFVAEALAAGRRLATAPVNA
jgi:hypothetical protein